MNVSHEPHIHQFVKILPPLLRNSPSVSIPQFFNMFSGTQKRRGGESRGKTTESFSASSNNPRRRPKEARVNDQPKVSLLQLQYRPTPAPPGVILPPQAYAIAVLQKSETSFTEFEQKLWHTCNRLQIKVAIGRRTVQRFRHLLAIRHLDSVQQLYIHRHVIMSETGWEMQFLRPRTPCVRLTNVPENLSNEELLTALLGPQNPALHRWVDCRDEIVIMKYRNSLALLQIPPELWHAFDDEPEVTMRHRLISVDPHYPLTQCYNCAQHGHTAANCQQKPPTCLFCGHSHTFPNCPHKKSREKYVCIHCQGESVRPGIPRHAANDYKVCPEAQHRQEARKRQTIYDATTYRALLHIWLRQSRSANQQTQTNRRPPSLSPEALGTDSTLPAPPPISPLFEQRGSNEPRTATAPATSNNPLLQQMPTENPASGGEAVTDRRGPTPSLFNTDDEADDNITIDEPENTDYNAATSETGSGTGPLHKYFSSGRTTKK